MIPGPGPNGGTLIRSAPSGPVVEVGGGSAPLAVRSQFENDQALNPEIVGDIVGATATFANVPAGAVIFVQSVLNFEGFGDSFADTRAVMDDGGGEVVIWQPGPVVWPAQGESPTFGKCPLQFQTPPLGAPAASVTVKLQANGASSVRSGHLQAELILP